jgi:hypothetical protein
MGLYMSQAISREKDITDNKKSGYLTPARIEQNVAEVGRKTKIMRNYHQLAVRRVEEVKMNRESVKLILTKDLNMEVCDKIP